MEMFSDKCHGCMEEKGQVKTCPKCGWVEGTQPESPLHLKPGTVLNGKYLIGKVLGHGGFGITYLACDIYIGAKLAIKEYFPSNLAIRTTGDITISVYSGSAKEHFEYGLDKFIDEAKILVKFDDMPEIVSVKDFFKENGTAYLVMNYVEGITLKEYLANNGGRLPVDVVLNIILPAMKALEQVHKAGMLHRDISPENIYVTKNFKVKLLDFGAARFAVGEHTQSLSVLLKPGYAPPEQYTVKGKQGPWTDVYAVAATIYRCITGENPPESLDRKDEDTLIPPSKLGIDIPIETERVLLKGLEVRNTERFISIAEFERALIMSIDKDRPYPPVEEKQDRTLISNSVPIKDEVPGEISETQRTATKKRLLVWVIAAAGLIAVVIIALIVLQPRNTSERIAQSNAKEAVEIYISDNYDSSSVKKDKENAVAKIKLVKTASVIKELNKKVKDHDKALASAKEDAAEKVAEEAAYKKAETEARDAVDKYLRDKYDSVSVNTDRENAISKILLVKTAVVKKELNNMIREHDNEISSAKTIAAEKSAQIEARAAVDKYQRDKYDSVSVNADRENAVSKISLVKTAVVKEELNKMISEHDKEISLEKTRAAQQSAQQLAEKSAQKSARAAVNKYLKDHYNSRSVKADRSSAVAKIALVKNTSVAKELTQKVREHDNALESERKRYTDISPKSDDHRIIHGVNDDV